MNPVRDDSATAHAGPVGECLQAAGGGAEPSPGRSPGTSPKPSPCINATNGGIALGTQRREDCNTWARKVARADAVPTAMSRLLWLTYSAWINWPQGYRINETHPRYRVIERVRRNGATPVVDLLVIGGGKADKSLAMDRAKAGWKVLMVERDKIGGTCINVACIPTKALVGSARTLLTARGAG